MLSILKKVARFATSYNYLQACAAVRYEAESGNYISYVVSSDRRYY